jgi:Two component regulator propeller
MVSVTFPIEKQGSIEDNSALGGRMKRTIFWGIALLFLPIFILIDLGRGADPGFLKRPLSFQQVTAKDGLSSEMVMAVAAVGEEVWFGTYAGGVTLYDRTKKTFKTYTTKGEPQEKDDGVSIKWKNHPAYNHVSVILPDKDRVWFGTYFYGFGGGGISYYMPRKKNPWRRFTTNKDVAKKIVSLAADGDLLYAGSEKGLSILDKKTEKWQSFYSTEDGLAGNFVNALLLQSDTLWAGTNAGISRLQIPQNAWKTYGQPQGLGDIEVKALASVGEKIWAATTRGALYEYDPGPDRWKKIEPSDPLKSGGINALAVIQGKMLVCRDNGVSVFEISRNQWDSITKADGLLSSTVFCAVEDKDGVWFGTDQGASRWNRVP